MTIAFKEWALVCDALGRGEQSVILRKGGIHEGRKGFQFEHPEFFLFPTLFHEQVARTKLPPETEIPAPENGVIRIKHLARAEWTALITKRAAIHRLRDFHIWSEAEIESRFTYENAGLNLAFVRVFVLAPPWELVNEPRYGGCRSWVTLPERPIPSELRPVIDDQTHVRRAAEIRAALET